MKIEPIRPCNISKTKKFPPEVIESFNELIEKAYNRGEATILQKDVVALICSKMDCVPNYLYVYNLLDIEELYEDFGWKVEYDKPGYNETYDATFTFSAKHRK